jgi:hypothetical protein
MQMYKSTIKFNLAHGLVCWICVHTVIQVNPIRFKYGRQNLFTLLTGSTAMHFTATGAPLAARGIRISAMNQHAWRPIVFGMNSVASVHERTIPTERPPLVGEVSANFCGYRMPRCQRDGSLRQYSRLSRPEPLLFFQVAPQMYSQAEWTPFQPHCFSENLVWIN